MTNWELLCAQMAHCRSAGVMDLGERLLQEFTRTRGDQPDALQGRSVSEIVEATGWTRAQAIRLLNAGLSTITATAPRVTSPSRPSAKMAR